MMFPKILKNSGLGDMPQSHSWVKQMPMSPNIKCESSVEGIVVGSLYEIDRSKLPQRCPSLLLHSIRAVMVTLRTERNVTVGYPSIRSLKRYFRNIESEDRTENLYPDMDENFVMGPQLAMLALVRRIPSREFAESRHHKAFWLVQWLGTEKLLLPVSENNPKYAGFLSNAEWEENMVGERDVNSKGATGLIALPDGEIKSTDSQCLSSCVGGHSQSTYPVPNALHDGEAKQRNTGYGTVNAKNLKKRKRASPGHDKQVRTPEQDSEQITTMRSSNAEKKSSDGRWNSVRYERAERIMLELLKEKGAVNGNPVSRAELRQMAREKIGDTGLLDHLLKHMVGRVASDGTLRFQRRCNGEGVREYWLESADLDKIRMEAGVKDPFWLPPPGWNPGEPLCTHACYYVAETKKLREDLARMESEMQKLVDEKRRDSLDTLERLDTDKLQLTRAKEVYKELLERKADTEKQLSVISEALAKMEALVKKQETSQNERTDS